MSSFDHRQQSTRGLQVPGLVNQLSPVEQLPFPDGNGAFVHTTQPLALDSSPGMAIPMPESIITQPLTRQDSAPGVTQILANNSSPGVTRLLPEFHVGSLTSSNATKTTRQLLLIRGSGKKSTGTLRPPKGRSWVVSSLILGIMLATTLTAAFAVAPLATGNKFGFNPFPFVSKLVQSNDSNLNPNFIAQAATATAIAHIDGYDQNAPSGGPIVTGIGGLYRFAYGQCTYWANYRYHALTGYWVPWLGNAYEWAYGARAAGWTVSATPHYPSIIVLQPGAQGAGYYGHVAIVEHINSDGSVYTSNYNWSNGGWNTYSNWTFKTGPGVLFVWHP